MLKANTRLFNNRSDTLLETFILYKQGRGDKLS
jgi:hypothetical protein